MANKEDKIEDPKTPEVEPQKSEPVLTDRQVRWEAALAQVAKQNPEAFAARKASGEFDKGIPDSFE